MGTRTLQVVEAIRHRVLDRSLTAGERLPSIRSLATTMGVSPSTVVEAYDRLAAEGIVRSRPGSGFFVAASHPPPALAAIEPRRDRDIDPLWVSRQALEAGAAALTPGCGWLPPAWMPQDVLRGALRRIARTGETELTDYGSTRGLPALRQFLARQLATEGIAVRPDDVLLTSSGTQAIDLVCRALLNPGDAVLLDDPCYFNFQALLRAHRARIVTVPYTPTGPDVAAFNAALEAHRPASTSPIRRSTTPPARHSRPRRPTVSSWRRQPTT
jgi:DNA-binding transcriptional MocR family regulator